MIASSQQDLNINQDRNDETCYSDSFEEGDFPVLKPSCDPQTPTYHSWSNITFLASALDIGKLEPSSFR